MDVAAYLKELLNRQQQVFVRGLGTFYIRRNVVEHYLEQQQFYPPKNSIEFVAEDKNDDALEKYISAQKNISQQASGYFIEKFADQLKTDANTKNILVKEVLFAEDDKPNASFNQENFGLPLINLAALNKQQTAETSLIAETESLPEKDQSENFYQQFSNETPEVAEPKKNSFWIAIALLLTICCLGIYALYLYNPNVFKNLLPNNQQKVAQTKPAIADTITRAPIAAQTEIQTDSSAKSTADTTVKSVTVVPPPQKTKIDTVKTADADLVAKSPYEIIGASFKTLKGAKTFLSQLQSRGMHNAKILNNTAGKQVLITFGSYQDKASAITALEKIRTKDSQSEAYIQHYFK